MRKKKGKWYYIDGKYMSYQGYKKQEWQAMDLADGLRAKTKWGTHIHKVGDYWDENRTYEVFIRPKIRKIRV